LDQLLSIEARGFPVSKPNTLVTAPIYAAIRQDRRFVGSTTGIGYHQLRRTKTLRAVQLLLGHTKLESTVRYLGIEVDDALEMAEQTEV
jgi:integrase